jgi:hypothetical protein
MSYSRQGYVSRDAGVGWHYYLNATLSELSDSNATRPHPTCASVRPHLLQIARPPGNHILSGTILHNHVRR